MTIKLTYREYALLPEGDRRELIEGDFSMTPAAGEKHQRLSRNLQFELHKFLDESPLGELYDAPFDVILEECTVVQPDLLIVLEDRRSRIVPEGLRGAPNFLVEILSPSAPERDRILKRRLYEKFGVQEYWILDPEAQTVEQLVAKQGQLETLATYHRQDRIPSAVVSGMEINLSRVFR